MEKQLLKPLSFASGDSPVTILYGAGISVASPSNLPTATRLLKHYHNKIIYVLEQNSIPLSKFPQFDDWANKLRFEETISILKRLGMDHEALEPLKKSLSSNINHRLLAKLYIKGCSC